MVQQVLKRQSLQTIFLHRLVTRVLGRFALLFHKIIIAPLALDLEAFLRLYPQQWLPKHLLWELQIEKQIPLTIFYSPQPVTCLPGIKASLTVWLVRYQEKGYQSQASARLMHSLCLLFQVYCQRSQDQSRSQGNGGGCFGLGDSAMGARRYCELLLQVFIMRDQNCLRTSSQIMILLVWSQSPFPRGFCHNAGCLVPMQLPFDSPF